MPTQSTHAPNAAATTSTPHSSPADQAVHPELKVHIRPRGLNFWEFEGTRAQLEAEGVIPKGTVWPEKAKTLWFQNSRLKFRLRRKRPEGLKGPQSAWSTGDWWVLHCTDQNAPSLKDQRIQAKVSELAAEIRRFTPEGERELMSTINRHLEAQGDKAFQAFMAKVAPEAKRPRKTKH